MRNGDRSGKSAQQRACEACKKPARQALHVLQDKILRCRFHWVQHGMCINSVFSALQSERTFRSGESSRNIIAHDKAQRKREPKLPFRETSLCLFLFAVGLGSSLLGGERLGGGDLFG